MEFNSFSFLIFFPAVLAVYFVIPKKLRYLWLLAASYYFYACWNAKYTLLLLLSTAVTYAGALLVEKTGQRAGGKKAAAVLTVTVAVNIGILAYFKYANFLISSVRDALSMLGISGSFSLLDVLLPVGISFYIFQAIGYIFDVYYGRLEPERNFLRYALFVAFFPQLVAGPIERATNLMPQLRNVDKIELWDIRRIQHGGLIMLYGFILKVVIADRAAIPVNRIFLDYMQYSAPEYLAALMLFAVQIYCDFAGYTYIAIGTAKIMGIELMNNFNAPYLAVSVRDFWSRWHISLTSWFRDYLYIPLGGSRRGKARKYLNLLIVFAVSGLWHGAAWHFMIWGVIQAVFLIAGELTEPPRKKLRARLGIKEDNRVLLALRTVLTFCLIDYSHLLFRAPDLSQAAYMSRVLFTFPWELTAGMRLNTVLGFTRRETALLCLTIVLLFVSDLFRKKEINAVQWFEKRSWVFRMAVFTAGIMFILVFGIYGPNYDASTFIYFQF